MKQHQVKVYGLHGFKALSAEGEGVFEAIVAVFNNVDRAGERILPGAFKGSLQRWEEKGRPIPVIFSHEWDNLDAHIGYLLDAKEVEKGLYVKGQLDMEEAFAARVWKKMVQGTLAEFSFAYDVLDYKEIEVEHVVDLVELELLEVGPCLVGMNPDTELLSVKTGARHTAKEYAQIQQIHDLAVELGAKCMEADGAEDSAGDEGDDGGEAAGAGDSAGGKSDVGDQNPSLSVARVRAALDLDRIEFA